MKMLIIDDNAAAVERSQQPPGSRNTIIGTDTASGTFAGLPAGSIDCVLLDYPDSLPVIHWATDRTSTLTYLGGASLHRLGLHTVSSVGLGVGILTEDAAARARMEQAHQRAMDGAETTFRVDLGGRIFQSHVAPLRARDGTALGARGVALDITEQIELERQLRHAVKMEAVGKLAGSVAHDLNNCLAAMLGFAGYARETLDAGSSAADDLDEVLRVGERAVNLTRQLMSFSRPHTTDARATGVAASLEAALPMLRRIAGADVRVSLVRGEDLWGCDLDPGLLEQVVVHLVVNACDAMSEGGAIELKLHNASIEGVVGRGLTQRVEAGDYVVLSVSDGGHGIPREIQDDIFDPYFSTRTRGPGAGLGLSAVRSIALQAGGAVTVDSEVGKGATFRVYLPRALAAAGGVSPSSSRGHEEPNPAHRTP